MSIPEDFYRVFDEIKARYDELGGESARAAAILSVSLLEDELESLILKKFPADLSERLWHKKICGPGHTPLGTFSAKADIAQAFGFYGPGTRKTLETISAVRNKFAHSATARRFTDSEVLRHCNKLRGSPFPNAHRSDRPNENDVRWHFLTTVRELHEKFEQRSQFIADLDEEPAPLP
jgi:hypothetical protein